MADKSQRTEKATAKHERRCATRAPWLARPEIGGWASLLLVASLLPWLGGLAANRISAFVEAATQAMAHPSIGGGGRRSWARGSRRRRSRRCPYCWSAARSRVAIAVAQVGPAHHAQGAARPGLANVAQGRTAQTASRARGSGRSPRRCSRWWCSRSWATSILHQLVNSRARRGHPAPRRRPCPRRSSTVVNLDPFHRVAGPRDRRRRLLLPASLAPAGCAHDQAGGQGRTPPERRQPRGPPGPAQPGPATLARCT